MRMLAGVSKLDTIAVLGQELADSSIAAPVIQDGGAGHRAADLVVDDSSAAREEEGNSWGGASFVEDIPRAPLIGIAREGFSERQSFRDIRVNVRAAEDGEHARERLCHILVELRGRE